MILLGNTQKEKEENVKSLRGKAKLIGTFFFITAFVPAILYFVFEIGLLKGKPRYNQYLEQSVALVNTGSNTGTAFLVSPTKLLTAKHVLANMNEGDVVQLTFESLEPQVTTNAKILWIDPSDDPEPESFLKDVAVLELENISDLPDGHPFLYLGESSGDFRQSEVIVIGYPSGLPSVTSGRISNDNLKGLELFQLNVDSWPGNSGGPLILEETEEVIGMVVGGMTEEYQGINFANKINNITNSMEKNGINLYE